MTGVQTCALPICFPVTISRAFGLLKRKERGELIIGLHQFADECKIGVGYVRKFLKLAEKDGMILVKSNKNGTHIKIINYKDLQSRQNQSEQDLNKMRTTL